MFEVNEFILKRLMGAMERSGLDAIVAYSPDNVAYSAGYIVPSHTLGIRNRQFAVAINRDGRAAMLLTSNELQEAQARSHLNDFRPYDEFTDDPMEVLAGALRDLGVANGKIGIELDAIPAERYSRLQSQFKAARWAPAAGTFAHARMVKSGDELQRLRRAAGAAEAAQAEAHAQVTVGMTERDLYRILSAGALKHGADKILMIQVAAGERSSFSNPVPSDRMLQRGDQVKIDMFVTVDGYLSDTGRTIVLASASQMQRDVWSRMQETLLKIEGLIRPGISTRELWNTFQQTFAKYSMVPKIRFLGHGLGLSLHEEPFMSAHSDTPLEAGMVFALEPNYKTDNVAFHLEDNIIVTADGIENMTNRFGSDLLVVG